MKNRTTFKNIYSKICIFHEIILLQSWTTAQDLQYRRFSIGIPTVNSKHFVDFADLALPALGILLYWRTFEQDFEVQQHIKQILRNREKKIKK